MNSTLLMVFTAVVVVTFVVQAIAIVRLARSLRFLSTQLEHQAKDISTSVKALSERVEGMVGSVQLVADKIQKIEDHLISTGEIIHRRVASLDAFLEDTTKAVRQQIARVQEVVESASHSMEKTFESLQRSALAPLREINAILTGVRVGLDILLRRRRIYRTAPHQDEEMFI